MLAPELASAYRIIEGLQSDRKAADAAVELFDNVYDRVVAAADPQGIRTGIEHVLENAEGLSEKKKQELLAAVPSQVDLLNDAVGHVLGDPDVKKGIGSDKTEDE